MYGCGPLSLAVLADDLPRVEFLLKYHPSTLGERNLLGQTPLHLAIEKPTCLRLLVQAASDELLDATDHTDTSAINNALFLSGAQCKQGTRRRKCRRCRCAEPTAILVKAGCALPVSEFLYVFLDAASYRCKLRYIRAMRDRRETLKHLALANFSSAETERLGLSREAVLDSMAPEVLQLLRRRGIRVPNALQPGSTMAPLDDSDSPPSVWSVYSALTNVFDADLFFQLGFHNTELPGEQYAIAIAYYHRWRTSLQYLQWLREHGTDILTLRLKSSDTGTGGVVSGHYTFWTIGSYISFGYLKLHGTKLFLLQLTEAAKVADSLDIPDNCQCRCSLRGCTPFIFLLKGIELCSYYPESNRKAVKMANALSIYLQAASVALEPKHHAAALRAFTFSALRIRHTCCKPYRSPNDRFIQLSPEEVNEVEEEQAYELALLEELLEEFEKQVSTILQNQDQDRIISDLVHFWKVIWVDRMAEVRARLESIVLSEDERRSAEEIGVVWDSPAPKPTPQDNPYDRKTDGYWFYELDQIEG